MCPGSMRTYCTVTDQLIYPGIHCTSLGFTKGTSPGKSSKWTTYQNLFQIHIQILLLYQEILYSCLLLAVSNNTTCTVNVSYQAASHTPPLSSLPATPPPQTSAMGTDTYRDTEGRCGSRLHGGVLLGDPAGHAAPLPAPLRGGLCGWNTNQRTITNTGAQEEPRNTSRPCKTGLLPWRCSCKRANTTTPLLPSEWHSISKTLTFYS